MSTITALSPAKVNLTLDVKTKVIGADFHELETIYHLLDWGDQITIQKSDKFELEGNFDCPLENNLIYKAWELMENHEAVKVTVKKHIPTGAGLGGGSSNAASFIIGYFELFDLGPIPPALVQKLGALGKDIPFFISQAECALGTNFGEEITPLNFNFSGQPIYIYLPNFKHPTAQAFGALSRLDTSHTTQLLQTKDLKVCGNGFDEFFEHKNYSKILKPTHLSQIYMSGSGSAFFSFEPLNIPHCEVIKTLLL